MISHRLIANLSFILAMTLGSMAWAAPGDARGVPARPEEKDAFPFVPAQSPSQQEFKKVFAAQEYMSALRLWNAAYAGSNYGHSDTGRALLALVLLKNQMNLSAIDVLTSIRSPKSVQKQIQTLLRDELHPNHLIWKLDIVKGSPRFLQFLSSESRAALQAFRFGPVSTISQIARAEQIRLQTRSESDPRAWIDYQLALGYAAKGETQKAISRLQALLNSNQSLISKDDLNLTIGRLLYEQSKLGEALNYYDAVSKGSDFWPETVEEKAWTHVRSKNYEKSLGQLQTLLTPVLANQVGPESYFLASYSNLKICDYNTVLKIHKEFKSNFKERLVAVDALTINGKSDAVIKSLDRIEFGKATLTQVGPDARYLPRHFHRDARIQKLAYLKRQTAIEKSILQNMAATNSILSSALVFVDQHASQILPQVFARTQALAKGEIAEMGRILAKLHIVEVEAIQRMHTYTKNQRENLSEEIDPNESLIFPYQGEVWMDELDNYQVQGKGCPKSQEKTL